MFNYMEWSQKWKNEKFFILNHFPKDIAALFINADIVNSKQFRYYYNPIQHNKPFSVQDLSVTRSVSFVSEDGVPFSLFGKGQVFDTIEFDTTNYFFNRKNPYHQPAIDFFSDFSLTALVEEAYETSLSGFRSQRERLLHYPLTLSSLLVLPDQDLFSLFALHVLHWTWTDSPFQLGSSTETNTHWINEKNKPMLPPRLFDHPSYLFKAVQSWNDLGVNFDIEKKGETCTISFPDFHLEFSHSSFQHSILLSSILISPHIAY